MRREGVETSPLPFDSGPDLLCPVCGELQRLFQRTLVLVEDTVEALVYSRVCECLERHDRLGVFENDRGEIIQDF